MITSAGPRDKYHSEKFNGPILGQTKENIFPVEPLSIKLKKLLKTDDETFEIIFQLRIVSQFRGVAMQIWEFHHDNCVTLLPKYHIRTLGGDQY